MMSKIEKLVKLEIKKSVGKERIICMKDCNLTFFVFPLVFWLILAFIIVNHFVKSILIWPLLHFCF